MPAPTDQSARLHFTFSHEQHCAGHQQRGDDKKQKGKQPFTRVPNRSKLIGSVETRLQPTTDSDILPFLCGIKRTHTAKRRNSSAPFNWQEHRVNLTSRSLLPVTSAPSHPPSCSCHHPWSSTGRSLWSWSPRRQCRSPGGCYLSSERKHFHAHVPSLRVNTTIVMWRKTPAAACHWGVGTHQV